MFEVRPLTNRTWADLEELFDLPGGSIVRGCWCVYYRKVGQVGIGKAHGPGNKEELHGLVRWGSYRASSAMPTARPSGGSALGRARTTASWSARAS